ncbi:MAG: hypothetical protein PHH98_04295 [Candidatus Gracilibacteria bacterium]|nr:hypothetical protein [Candidatus Gracilibacteria bacterium]
MDKIDLYLQAMWDAITFEFALKIAIIYFFIIWIALIVWVIKDISIRSNSLFFQSIAVLTILLLSPFGIFIYLLIRPRRTLYDKYYEEIEENLDIFNEIVEERKKELEKNINIKVIENSNFKKEEFQKTEEKVEKSIKIEEHLDEVDDFETKKD